MISDIDNFMRGNPLFADAKGMAKYEETDMFEGSNKDPKISYDVREFN